MTVAVTVTMSCEGRTVMDMLKSKEHHDSPVQYRSLQTVLTTLRTPVLNLASSAFRCLWSGRVAEKMPDVHRACHDPEKNVSTMTTTDTKASAGAGPMSYFGPEESESLLHPTLLYN